MGKSLSDTIYELENKLLSPETRNSPDKISKLLSEDFFEHCSSGNIYYFKEGDSFPYKTNEPQWQIENFKIKNLSDDLVLATYRCNKNNNSDNQFSVRCSIWKLNDNHWKIIFHQGTNIPEIIEKKLKI